MSNIFLSIVIITYNSERFIRSCLKSIYSQDYQGSELIIVDNGSSDNTVAIIKENYPQVVLIENKQNLGACKGRNQGIEIAKAGWILTLDCDTILREDFFYNAKEFLNKPFSSKIGMIQPKIFNIDKKTVYSCGISLSGLRRFYDIGKNQPDDGRFNDYKYIFGACTAAALYRRQMLEEIKEDTGYFDERFFFLVEDVDLSWRAQKKGWRTLYCPEIVCYHKGNSSGFDKKFRQYLCFCNRFYSIMKNEGLLRYCIRIFPLLCYDLPRLAYLLLTNKYLFRNIFKRILANQR